MDTETSKAMQGMAEQFACMARGMHKLSKMLAAAPAKSDDYFATADCDGCQATFKYRREWVGKVVCPLCGRDVVLAEVQAEPKATDNMVGQLFVHTDDCSRVAECLGVSTHITGSYYMYPCIDRRDGRKINAALDDRQWWLPIPPRPTDESLAAQGYRLVVPNQVRVPKVGEWWATYGGIVMGPAKYNHAGEEDTTQCGGRRWICEPIPAEQPAEPEKDVRWAWKHSNMGDYRQWLCEVRSDTGECLRVVASDLSTTTSEMRTRIARLLNAEAALRELVDVAERMSEHAPTTAAIWKIPPILSQLAGFGRDGE